MGSVAMSAAAPVQITTPRPKFQGARSKMRNIKDKSPRSEKVKKNGKVRKAKKQSSRACKDTVKKLSKSIDKKKKKKERRQITDLPMEMLDHILSFVSPSVLTRVSPVSPNFEAICCYRLLIAADFTVTPSTSYTECKEVLQNCPALKKLELSKRKKGDFNRLGAQALQNCPDLVRLDLIECKQKKVSSILLRAIKQWGTSLRMLNMHGTSIDLRLTKMAADSFSQLTHLDLGYSKGPRDRLLMAVADGCHNLLSLDLSNGCSSDDTMNHVLARIYGTIRRLRFDASALTEESLVNVGLCNLLTSLEMTVCWNLNNQCLAEIAERCPKLTRLNLHRGESLTDDGVRTALNFCRQLKQLGLVGVKGVTTEAFEKTSTLLITELALDVCEDWEEIRRKLPTDTIITPCLSIDKNFYA